jgi:hypothetical protein
VNLAIQRSATNYDHRLYGTPSTVLELRRARMPVMITLDAVDAPGMQTALSDPHDRALVRHMLTLTPTERLRNVSAYWPLIRVGLERRAATGAVRP